MAQVERDKCCAECTHFNSTCSSCTLRNLFVSNKDKACCGSFEHHKFSFKELKRGEVEMCYCTNDTCKQKEDTELKNPFDTQIGGSHYKVPGVMDVTEWCMAHDLDIGEFNVIKYIFRHDKKNGIEDLRKAKHYLEMIAYTKYKENL